MARAGGARMGCAATESNQRRRNPSHSARLMTRDSSVCVLSSAGCRELTAPIAPVSFVHMSRSKCSGSLGAFLSGLIVSFLGGAGRAPTADEEDAIADGKPDSRPMRNREFTPPISFLIR